jgi:hypothetical protein
VDEILSRMDGGLSLAGAGRSVVLAGERVLAVPPPLAGLFPEGGLRRGSTVSLAGGAGAGVTALALALTVPVTGSGSWVAAVGLPSLGLVAAAQMGAALDRLALVPSAGEQWAVVVAALLESVDLLLLAPHGRVRPADARRLTARARERGAVLVILPPGGTPAARWPEATDLVLTVETARWEGLEGGTGHLRSRLLDVVATGRRAAARPRRRQVWLPGPDGRIAAAPTGREARQGATGSGGTGSGGTGSGGTGPAEADPLSMAVG